MKNLYFFHEKALKIRLSKLGENHVDTSNSYYQLGSLFKSMGRLEESLENFEKSYNIRHKKYGKCNIQTQKSFNSVVDLRNSLSKKSSNENENVEI